MYNTSKDNCPRGFYFCKDKQECVPERSEVGDKLQLKYERYFFKEEKTMEQKCYKGFRWCPITHKCVPDDDSKMKGRKQGRGQGSGPIGKPYKETFEILDKKKEVENKLEKLLGLIKYEKDNKDDEELGTATISTSRPYDHPIKARMNVDIDESDDISGILPGEDEYDEYDDGEANDIPHAPNQHGGTMYSQIIKQMSEYHSLTEDKKSDYKEYFNNMLKQFGVSSPSELDDSKKKDFFNKVDAGWKAKNEK